jgi:hypothetical protein
MEHRSPPGWLTLGLPPKMPPHRRASAFDGLGHIPLHVSRRALALRRGGGHVTACRVHAGCVSGRPRPPPISRSSPTSGRRGGNWPCRPRSRLRGRLGDRCRGSATSSVPSRLPSAVSNPMDPRSSSSASAGHPRRFERLTPAAGGLPWPPPRSTAPVAPRGLSEAAGSTPRVRAPTPSARWGWSRPPPPIVEGNLWSVLAGRSV